MRHWDLRKAVENLPNDISWQRGFENFAQAKKKGIFSAHSTKYGFVSSVFAKSQCRCAYQMDALASTVAVGKYAPPG